MSVHKKVYYESIIAYIDSARPDDDAHFHKVFARAVCRLDKDSYELAGELGFSLRSIERWTVGAAAPHPVARKAILRALRRVFEEKLEQKQ